ncbi:SCO family protein [Campylobacter armoricus]|uniref:Cytochrome oxidase copper insertion factor, SCO1/SenC/PrrC family n=1 Tax=Campylobacter armoricus TaxID=2505970 RepID=A0A7L5I1U1_9BACT|nr:SCO family protein [Campylobacter armoricus]QKF80061.1 cytochrome oxidase copper insertion factor, SCO1/SenC/PrrC family [Campylobacter armoricus]
MKKINLFLLIIVIFGVFYISVQYFESNKYNFHLNSEKGMLSLKDFIGKKLIVYFGYTYCPDVCPTELALIGNVLEKIPNREKAHIVFISLDPQRDSNLTQTSQWVKYFYPNSTALVANNEKELEKITKNYGVIYEKVQLKDSAMKYSIAHSGEFYLIDEKGKFVKTIKDISYENFYNEIKKFLNE